MFGSAFKGMYWYLLIYLSR